LWPLESTSTENEKKVAKFSSFLILLHHLVMLDLTALLSVVGASGSFREATFSNLPCQTISLELRTKEEVEETKWKIY